MSGPAATTHIMIDGFLIDCSIKENHSFDSDITDYPVESGANISDNIRPLPIVVEIEGLVSNTPIGLMVAARAGFAYKPAGVAYQLFQRIRERREPVTIQTSLRTYENMALKSLSIPRGEHEDSMKFTATFQQIETVENKRTIRVSTPIGTGKKTVTIPPQPADIRQVIIDRKNLMWWDPDFSTWRFHCSFEKGSVVEETGFTTIIPGKWHLYRGAVQQVTKKSNVSGAAGQDFGIKDDPFDMLRFVPPHPVRQQIIVTTNQCVLHDGKGGTFVIKKPLPGGITTSTKSVLKNRTL